MAVDKDPEAQAVTDVAELFGEVARQLLEEQDLTDTLTRIVQLAEKHLDACECAGVSIVEGRKITSPAASGEVALTMDRIQEEVGEGPCLDALKKHEIFQTGCLLRETRWPMFSTRGHEETGTMSVLGIRLFAEAKTYGALNLYSSVEDAFDETAVALASVFATHAAVAIHGVKAHEQLQHKAETRDLIGGAKGILMSREHVTEEAAFDLC